MLDYSQILVAISDLYKEADNKPFKYIQELSYIYWTVDLLTQTYDQLSENNHSVLIDILKNYINKTPHLFEYDASNNKYEPRYFVKIYDDLYFYLQQLKSQHSNSKRNVKLKPNKHESESEYEYQSDPEYDIESDSEYEHESNSSTYYKKYFNFNL